MKIVTDFSFEFEQYEWRVFKLYILEKRNLPANMLTVYFV